MIESSTKGMGCSMLITPPSMVMEPRSSSIGSTMSVSSAGSTSKKTTNKEEEVEGREHLLLVVHHHHHHHHSVSFDHPGAHCRPLLKNGFSRGFSRAGIREENHFHFLHDKEANDMVEEQKGRTTDDDHDGNASGGGCSSSSSCWWQQEEPPPCGRGQEEVSAHARHLSSSTMSMSSDLLVLDSSSSSRRTTRLFTDGLKRLQECMTRTGESRRRLLVQQKVAEAPILRRRSRSSGSTSTTTSGIRIMKTFVALRAAARRDKKVELLFLTGDRGRGIKKNHGRMIVACPQDCHSSSWAKSVGRKEQVTSTSGSSCKGRSMSTWPTKKKKQQQQGPFMAECLLEGYPR
jgi:hypothetical protein